MTERPVIASEPDGDDCDAAYWEKGFAEPYVAPVYVTPVYVDPVIHERDLPVMAKRADKEAGNSEGHITGFKPNQFLIETMKSVDKGLFPAVIDMPKGVFTLANEMRTGDQKRLLWDKRIIDLYYRYIRHRKTFYCDDSAGFRKLFEGDIFDLDLANELVTTKGSIRAVLNYLGLDARKDVQVELCAYRSKEVVRHHKQSRSRQSINAMVYRYTPRASLDDVEQHYQVN